MKPLTRPSELVLSAIYNLDEVNGSSSQQIVSYISGNCGINSDELKEKVEAALKRGLSFGLISKDPSGLYKLKDLHELPESPTNLHRSRRKRNTKTKKEARSNSSGANFQEPKSDTANEKRKRMRMEAGESSRNPGAKLESSVGCINLNSRKRR